MKRKLTSVLLALALCLPLAASTPASGAKNPPAQRETVALTPEGAPADPAEGEGTIITSEGPVWVWVTPKYGQLPPVPDDEIEEALADLIEREGELDPGKTYVLMTEYGHMCWDDPCQCSAAADMKLDGIASAGTSEAGICPACGKDNWGPATDTDSALVRISDDYHGELYNTVYICKTLHCDYFCRIHKIKQAAPHSWDLTATTGNSGNEDPGHRFTFYECECGAGKAETTTS